MPQYDRKDKFYQKAKKEGYPARSAYKLIEMDKSFKILKPGSKIVDLGCAPGGWLKVVEERLTKNEGSSKLPADRRGTRDEKISRSGVPAAKIVGIDLLPLQFTPSPGNVFIQGDFLDPAKQKEIIDTLNGPADWVLSDMSPNISGIKFKDFAASMELAESVLEFAKKILKKGGGLIIKVFPGPEMGNLRKELKQQYQTISTVEPEATRKTSNEVYLIAQGFRGNKSR